MNLTEILHNGNHSLVVAINGEVRTYDGRGVYDIFQIYPELEGAEVADKVVGKGAAALMILGKVKAVYADVISEPALALFKENNVDVKYSKLTPNIINRTGNGLCPVETLCLECKTLNQCLEKITEFITKNG